MMSAPQLKTPTMGQLPSRNRTSLPTVRPNLRADVAIGVSQYWPSGRRYGTKPQRCSAAKDGVDARQDKLQAPRRNLAHPLSELLLVEGHDKRDVRDRIL